jgi:putative hemolysin
MLAQILIVLALILANAVFAGAEIAVLNLRKTRLAQLLEDRSAGARAVQALRKTPERFLATVQIGITVVGATAAAFGGESLAGPLGRALERAGTPYPHSIGLGLVIAGISYLSLVVGELVPKSLALRHSERYALLVAPPLVGLSRLAAPLVWFLTASSNVILRLFGDRTSFAESRLAPEELQQMVEEAARTGAIDQRVAEIASRAFDFSDLRAGAVMLPRARIVAVRRTASVDEVLAACAEYGHKRMPVYEESLDKIVGYVVAKDVILWHLDRQLLVMDDIMRPPYFVPESMRAMDVLREMQKRRVQMAIVLDEHGAVAGLVTIEDLVEELVGDILAEHEKPDAVAFGQDGTAVVAGHMPIREVNRMLDLELPEGEGYSTVGGLCMRVFGAIPERGAKARLEDGTELEVLESTNRRVDRVRVKPRAKPGGAGAA